MTKHPTLLKLIWQNNQAALLVVLMLNLWHALIGIGVLAFINDKLLTENALTLGMAVVFVFLILLLFISGFLSQYGVTFIGHLFVYRLRTTFIQELLNSDISHLERLGTAKILASLSIDLQGITMGFVRLPELLGGVVVSLLCVCYLFYLSPVLAVVIVLWLVISTVMSTWLVKHVYAHLESLRLLNDRLYEQYQSVLEGATALKFNRHRAESIFKDLKVTAQTYQKDIIKADTFHLSAVNLSGIMVFFGMGVVLMISHFFDIADKQTAISACLVMLFMQSPLLKAVGAYPVLQSAKVNFEKMMSLGLPLLKDTAEDFFATPSSPFDRLELKDVTYQYPNGTFALTPVNLELHQGEIVFLVGENGSGKTTLAKLLTGLYAPTHGQIWLNGEPVRDNSRYRQYFSAVFSEVYLFDQLLGKNGGVPDDALIDKWLKLLKLNDKITLNNHTLSTTQLSQGQKKRLALLIALCEEKPILLLDEWAADQDPEYRKFFYDEILPMLKAMDKTLFVISHDDRFFHRADRILVMKNGTLSQINTTTS